MKTGHTVFSDKLVVGEPEEPAGLANLNRLKYNN